MDFGRVEDDEITGYVSDEEFEDNSLKQVKQLERFIKIIQYFIDGLSYANGNDMRPFFCEDFLSLCRWLLNIIPKVTSVIEHGENKVVYIEKKEAYTQTENFGRKFYMDYKHTENTYLEESKEHIPSLLSIKVRPPSRLQMRGNGGPKVCPGEAMGNHHLEHDLEQTLSSWDRSNELYPIKSRSGKPPSSKGSPYSCYDDNVYMHHRSFK